MLHAPKIGTEYEVANGEVAHSLGERRTIMRIAEKAKDELDISFQVIEDVHEPLLAVSSIVKQGHKVAFAEENAHIALKIGGHIPMTHINSTYELDIWIQKPGFTGQSARLSHS